MKKEKILKLRKQIKKILKNQDYQEAKKFGNKYINKCYKYNNYLCSCENDAQHEIIDCKHRVNWRFFKILKLTPRRDFDSFDSWTDDFFVVLMIGYDEDSDPYILEDVMNIDTIAYPDRYIPVSKNKYKKLYRIINKANHKRFKENTK